jgi:anthranilate synthase component 2
MYGYEITGAIFGANVRVLVIDNYDSFTNNLTQIVRECGAPCDVAKNDRVEWDTVDRYEKILLSPGPGVPVEAGRTCELINRFAPTKSILGICLGHQAIAEVFGGKLQQLPGPSHGFAKRMHIAANPPYILRGLPPAIDGGLYHSWAVAPSPFPESLRITVQSHDGTIMGISHRSLDVHGIQFHPESIMTDHGRTILHNWLSHNRYPLHIHHAQI